MKLINSIIQFLFFFFLCINMCFAQEINTDANCVISTPIEQYIDFGSGLHMNVKVTDKQKLYLSEKFFYLLDVSQITRLKIATISSMSDCERWISQERKTHDEILKQTVKDHQLVLESMRLTYDKILLEKKSLQTELIKNKERESSDLLKAKIIYGNIGLASGIVLTIIVIKLL